MNQEIGDYFDKKKKDLSLIEYGGNIVSIILSKRNNRYPYDF